MKGSFINKSKLKYNSTPSGITTINLIQSTDMQNFITAINIINTDVAIKYLIKLLRGSCIR